MTIRMHVKQEIRRGLYFGASFLLSLFLINAAMSQTAEKAKAPAAKKAAAPAKLPDWNGVWVVADFFMDKQDHQGSVAAPPRASTIAKRMKDTPPPPPPKFKGKYADEAKAFRAAMFKGLPTPDPSADCLPQGLALFWNGPYAFEIMQTPRQINFFQEWNEQTHRVYLDGRKHPEDPDPTYNGHAIGRWEGATLVIETIGFTTDSYLQMGVHHSEQMRITEKVRQLDTDLIEITQTITDPEALLEPYTQVFKLRRKPDMQVMEYVCAQNNRNKTEADGTTGLILQDGKK